MGRKKRVLEYGQSDSKREDEAMYLYAVNTLLVAGLSVGLYALHSVIRKRLWAKVTGGLQNLLQRRDDLKERLAELPPGEVEHQAHLERQARQVRRLARTIMAVDIAATLLALIPVGAAAYSLITNHQLQALQFNVVGLGILIVTKGGLLLLTYVIKPAVMGASGYTGTQVAKKVWERQKEQGPKH